ncbi:MAG: hypothetical protein ACRDQA_08885, partial [Nocardioidaceae bacterium]
MKAQVVAEKPATSTRQASTDAVQEQAESTTQQPVADANARPTTAKETDDSNQPVAHEAEAKAPESQADVTAKPVTAKADENGENTPVSAVVAPTHKTTASSDSTSSDDAADGPLGGLPVVDDVAPDAVAPVADGSVLESDMDAAQQEQSSAEVPGEISASGSTNVSTDGTTPGSTDVVVEGGLLGGSPEDAPQSDMVPADGSDPGSVLDLQGLTSNSSLPGSDVVNGLLGGLPVGGDLLKGAEDGIVINPVMPSLPHPVSDVLDGGITVDPVTPPVAHPMNSSPVSKVKETVGHVTGGASPVSKVKETVGQVTGGGSPLATVTDTASAVTGGGSPLAVVGGLTGGGSPLKLVTNTVGQVTGGGSPLAV